MESFTLRSSNEDLNIIFNKGIYIEDALQLRETFEASQEKFKNITIDMGKVDYMDSTGLGVLVMMKKKAELNGGNLYLKNISSSVNNLLKLTRLDTVFNVL